MRLFVFSFLLLMGTAQANEFSVLPTKLRITVINGLGNYEEGAKVAIYTKKEDYLESKNPLDTAFTNTKGVVVFKKLQPIPYYLEVRKGDMNNDGEGSLTGALLEGRINRVNVVIE